MIVDINTQINNILITINSKIDVNNGKIKPLNILGYNICIDSCCLTIDSTLQIPLIDYVNFLKKYSMKTYNITIYNTHTNNSIHGGATISNDHIESRIRINNRSYLFVITL